MSCPIYTINNKCSLWLLGLTASCSARVVVNLSSSTNESGSIYVHKEGKWQTWIFQGYCKEEWEKPSCQQPTFLYTCHSLSTFRWRNNELSPSCPSWVCKSTSPLSGGALSHRGSAHSSPGADVHTSFQHWPGPRLFLSLTVLSAQLGCVVREHSSSL